VSSDDTRQVDLPDVLRSFREKWASDLHTAIPARVERYDSAKQAVDVQPMIRRQFEDEEGNLMTEVLPVVTGCPVALPGGGGYALTFPISAGDTGLLILAEGSIDKWVARGPTDPTDPGFHHRHSIADGIFIPGVRTYPGALKSAPTDRARLGQDGGLSIDVTAALIKLGGEAATQRAVLGDLLSSAFSTFNTAFFAAYNSYVATLAGSIPPPTAADAAHAALFLALQGFIANLDSAIFSALSATVKVKP
jgi:hypothetical protein